MTKRPARPRDPNQLAKAIVDIVTGDDANGDMLSAPTVKGRPGGLSGGRARRTPFTRTSLRDRQAAAAKRWKNPTT